MDVQAYFARIGYSGPRDATLRTLRELHLRHAQLIPFENLNPYLGLAVPLDIATLERKLVLQRRGGYCFEQNLLLGEALRSLGFKVRGLAARVTWNAPQGFVSARTHMLLHLDLEEGPHLADVGFGGMTLTGPLRLVADIEQQTPHEPFRLLAEGPHFIMQAKVREGWRSLYQFDLQEQVVADYEVTNWYLANHPESRFVRNLVAARATPDRRFALLNNELAVHHLGGPSERRVLESVAALRNVLENALQIELPDVPHLDAALQRALDPR
ncbi:MAG TPA: arylamine N-acetyltransferase [Steroidobacteraceae bacterium]|nr:arylamine N-acetyltransferase [Steroidobacteraceae bacterium]